MNAPDSIADCIGASTLMVMLPGALMRPEHMVDAGMFQAVRERGLDLDLLAVNLHALGGCNRQALDHLRDEVLAPARKRYDKVWLAGISRGGQLVLSSLAEHAAPVDGVCLLAPYPGSRLTTNRIRQAGGLEVWQPGERELEDPEFRLWRWLRQPDFRGPVFLGYGAHDRFADGMQLLVRQLPDATFLEVDGVHDWLAWMPLWSMFLDEGYFEPEART